MKILIISQFAGSALHGMVLRNYLMAREWVRQGHEVSILASSYSHFRSSNPVCETRISHEMIDGVAYIWVKGPRYANRSAFGRIASIVVFTGQCMYLPVGLDAHYDVVIASSPHPFIVYPAVKFARRLKARFIYDIRDLWPLTPMHLGGMAPGHPFIRAAQAAEDYACRNADLVTAVPAACEPYLRTRGLAPGRFMAVANGIPSDKLTARPSLPAQHVDCLGRLRNMGVFLIGYTGTLGLANAMDSAIEAIGLASKRVHLAIVGNGSYRQDLITLAEQLGCADRVHFLDPIDRDQVPTFLDGVDAGYAATSKSPLYQYGASLTKVNDYMLASLPIIYAVGDPSSAVEVSGCGIVCEPGSPQAIAAAMEEIADMPAQARAALGLRGRQWCLENQLVAVQCERIIARLGNLQPRQVMRA